MLPQGPQRHHTRARRSLDDRGRRGSWLARKSCSPWRGEIRPDLFGAACFRLPVEHLAVALELDGIAKREVRAPEAQAGNITIELGQEEIRLNWRCSFAGPPARSWLGFATEVGSAPLVCRISAKTSQNGLAG